MMRTLLLALSAGASLAHPAMAEGASARGKALFQQRCAMCHATTGAGGGIGPNLAGVYGRRSAATAFNYSPAMRKAGLTWNAATLSAYLASPTKKVPGVRMTIATPNAKDRDDIIAFLKAGG